MNELIDEKISTTLADGKKIIYPTVSLSANSASSAELLLKEYINTINAHVWNGKITELSKALQQEVANLKKEKERIYLNVETVRKNNIKLLESARYIAEKSNIRDFDINAMQGNANVDKGDFLFYWGTKALDAQIFTLKNKPLTLPYRYYEIENIIDDLNKLKLENTRVNSFNYVDMPNTPVKIDKPNRIMLILGGVFIGFIFGCLIALFFSTKNRK